MTVDKVYRYPDFPDFDEESLEDNSNDLQILIHKVKDWARERELFTNGTPKGQVRKTLEESLELLEGIDTADSDKIIDSIGDIIVTLIIQAEMQGVSIEACLQKAYEEIKDRKGSLVNGSFVKEE